MADSIFKYFIKLFDRAINQVEFQSLQEIILYNFFLLKNFLLIIRFIFQSLLNLFI